MKLTKLAVFAALASLATSAFAGDIKGTVKYTGSQKPGAAYKATKDQKTCGATVPNEELEVKDGKLANVVVTIKGTVAGAKMEKKDISVDQDRCRYVPHVQAALVGSKVNIINSDPVLHNVHGYLGAQTAFNMAMPIKGQKIPKPLNKAGVVKIKCDVHSWMNGWIVVAENPFFATTKADGSFELKDVPAGTYTVTFWHEKLGEKTQQVTVPASGAVTADQSF